MYCGSRPVSLSTARELLLGPCSLCLALTRTAVAVVRWWRRACCQGTLAACLCAHRTARVLLACTAASRLHALLSGQHCDMSVACTIAKLRSCRWATLAYACERNIRCSGGMLDRAGGQNVEPVWVGHTRGAGTLHACGERYCMARPAFAVWSYHSSVQGASGLCDGGPMRDTCMCLGRGR